tara:strand:+ start:515 stop:661 length:147 start_codon:yes stop_codon:yes gene_type:complete
VVVVVLVLEVLQMVVKVEEVVLHMIKELVIGLVLVRVVFKQQQLDQVG